VLACVGLYLSFVTVPRACSFLRGPPAACLAGHVLPVRADVFWQSGDEKRHLRVGFCVAGAAWQRWCGAIPLI